MNQNWPRWILASLNKHFADAFAAANVNSFVEGQVKDNNITDCLEIRVDGPYFIQIDPKTYDSHTEVNILVQCVQDPRDLYKNSRLAGIALAAFKPITVCKLGNQVGDDGSAVACLTIIDKPNDRRDWRTINNFGKVDLATGLIQSSVEAHFGGDFTDSEN